MPYKNPKKKKEYNKEYRKKNREQLLRKDKKYQEKNKILIAKRAKRYYIQVVKKRRKKWRKCIVCKKDIFGIKKKKYCDSCRSKKRSERATGNQYWKLVKNRKRGKDCPNWRGGVTFWKKRIWDSPKYKKWRTAVFERDNYTCQECGIKNGNGKTIYLEVHHLKSFTELLRKHKITCREEAEKCKELWKINLGKTLCYKCHQKTKNGRPKKKTK